MTQKEAKAEVLRIRETIAEPTEQQSRWMKVHSLAHKIYYASKRNCWCSHCGHVFAVDALTEECRCPHCGETFQMQESRRQKYNDNAYCAILTTRGEWQVIRYFCIECHTYKADSKLSSIDYAQSYNITEVLRKWYNPGVGMRVTERIQLKAFPQYCRIPYRTWDYYNQCVPPLKVTRGDSHGYGYYGEDWNSEWFIKSVYPHATILPYYRKRGLALNNAAAVALDKFMQMVDSKPWAETLVKMGQYNLANCELYDNYCLLRHKDQIKIALRHGLDFEKIHLRDYEDYLRELETLGMDTHNPRFLAPADFAAEHARLTAIILRRREEEDRRREQQRSIEQKKKDQLGKAAMEERARIYANLVIAGFGMEIRPLLSADQYIEEGIAMHHCVGTYINNTTSLILSARKDGQRVETIEIDTRTWKIIQSRAVCNGASPQHDQIISLMKKNIPAIRQMSLAA